MPSVTRLFGINCYHSPLYFWGMVAMAVSLPFSKVGMSISGLFLLGNWLVERDFQRKFYDFIHNKPAVISTTLFWLFVPGILYSTDLNFAFNDLKNKVILFILPLIVSTSPVLSKKQLNTLLTFFIVSVIASSLVSVGILFFGRVNDFREASPFISHIRLSLLVCFSIFILFGMLKNQPLFTWKTFFIITGVIYLCFFLVLLEAATGIVIFLLLFSVFLVIFLLKIHNKALKYTLLSAFFTVIIILGVWTYKTVHSYFPDKKPEITTLEKYTANGNLYDHQSLGWTAENGHFLNLYISWDELSLAWKKRSQIPFDSLDNRHQQLKYTLIRYLNSKGLRKDSAGVAALTQSDVQAIENGIANVEYLKKLSVKKRIYEFLWEAQHFRQTGDPSGHSIMQRLEFWKAALGIIREHPLTGVGTGDPNQAFAYQYETMNSFLAPKWRLRSHNQFFAVAVTCGIPMMFWFIFALFYPPLRLKKFQYFYFTTFFLIAVLSMLNEDTLETQAGVTFFALWNSVLLFGFRESDLSE